MTDRELDRAIAEKVFGVRIREVRGMFCLETSDGNLLSFGNAFRRTPEKAWMENTLKYSTDPGACMSLLLHTLKEKPEFTLIDPHFISGGFWCELYSDEVKKTTSHTASNKNPLRAICETCLKVWEEQ